MTTMSQRKPRVKAPDEFLFLRRPICPCEMVPEGLPGAVSINGGIYLLGYNATLPEVGQPVVYGYRLTKDDGTVYDIPSDLSGCDCRGSERWAPTRGPLVCKHVRCVAYLREQGRLA
jgi:hypothetical protein